MMFSRIDHCEEEGKEEVAVGHRDEDRAEFEPEAGEGDDADDDSGACCCGDDAEGASRSRLEAADEFDQSTGSTR